MEARGACRVLIDEAAGDKGSETLGGTGKLRFAHATLSRKPMTGRADKAVGRTKR